MSNLSVLSYKGASIFLNELERRRHSEKVLVPLLDKHDFISIMRVYVSSMRRQYEEDGSKRMITPNPKGHPRHPNSWTYEELAVIDEYYSSEEDIPFLLSKLNRSESSIIRKLKRLGVWKE